MRELGVRCSSSGGYNSLSNIWANFIRAFRKQKTNIGMKADDHVYSENRQRNNSNREIDQETETEGDRERQVAWLSLITGGVVL